MGREMKRLIVRDGERDQGRDSQTGRDEREWVRLR